MKMSQLGLAALQQREGVRLVAYLDTKGIPTIGVGHTGPEVHLGLIWTTEQVMDALSKDSTKCEDCVNTKVKTPLTQNQFDALCSFIFNVGVGAFTRSTMLKLLNQGDYAGATKQFDRWVIPKEITSRRMSEKRQFQQT